MVALSAAVVNDTNHFTACLSKVMVFKKQLEERSIEINVEHTLPSLFTVAEVMYMVGFSNHSYFAKRFQEKYGKSPRQYAEEVTTSDSDPLK